MNRAYFPQLCSSYGRPETVCLVSPTMASRSQLTTEEACLLLDESLADSEQEIFSEDPKMTVLHVDGPHFQDLSTASPSTTSTTPAERDFFAVVGGKNGW